MQTLYLDCGMGAAGDMLAGALLDLLPDPEAFMDRLNSLGLAGVEMSLEKAQKSGITGRHFRVRVDGEEEESLDVHSHVHGHDHHHAHDHDHHHDHHHAHAHDHDHDHDHGHAHHHAHHGMAEIRHLVQDHLDLPPKVKEDILGVYGLIAEAESKAHGMPVDQIHFHEVGTMDALADITAVCLLMDQLGPDQVIASPVHVGSGKVRAAHGILPVPAPATAFLLKDVPIYGGSIEGELCTPTGAALLKYFVTRFGAMPLLKPQAIGYGMGTKDFPVANTLRAILGESPGKTDDVLELSCNVDDMTGEQIAFAMDRLFEGGALEVYTIPIGMKKSRPGTLIRAMCRLADREKILELLFKYTTTIGIRETRTMRYVLDREETLVESPYGPIRRKDSTGYGVRRFKYEYEDLARIARDQGMSISDLLAAIQK